MLKEQKLQAFSKWNDGLKDRFQEEFIPGNENSVKEGDEDDELHQTILINFYQLKQVLLLVMDLKEI
jgi:hypothetical protein